MLGIIILVFWMTWVGKRNWEDQKGIEALSPCPGGCGAWDMVR